MDNINPETIDWEKSDGLVPAVVQNASTLRVLMLGYMNRESFVHTQQSGKVTFYSRSRKTLWQKGETSGNTLNVCSIEVDCDADTILVMANPQGPTCHRLTNSCFDSEQNATAATNNTHIVDTIATGSPDSVAFLIELQQLIASRRDASPESSYTASLFESGSAKIAQKVGEEGVEVALAAVLAAQASGDEADHEKLESDLLGESADLIYHLLVVLANQGLSISDVVKVLQSRMN